MLASTPRSRSSASFTSIAASVVVGNTSSRIRKQATIAHRRPALHSAAPHPPQPAQSQLARPLVPPDPGAARRKSSSGLAMGLRTIRCHITLKLCTTVDSRQYILSSLPMCLPAKAVSTAVEPWELGCVYAWSRVSRPRRRREHEHERALKHVRLLRSLTMAGQIQKHAGSARAVLRGRAATCSTPTRTAEVVGCRCPRNRPLRPSTISSYHHRRRHHQTI